MDVLRELMGHRSLDTTARPSTNSPHSSSTATASTSGARPAPSWRVNTSGWRSVRSPSPSAPAPNPRTAAGGACPFRFRCLGCSHFRSDPSYLPELRDYLDTLLRDRERVLAATELQEWARAEAMPSEAEVTRLRQLIRRVEDDLTNLSEEDRQQIEEAVRIVRRTRQAVHLGMPAIAPPALDPQLETVRP